MKKIMAAFMALMLSASFVACSPKAPDVSPEPTEAATDEAATTDEDPIDQTFEPETPAEQPTGEAIKMTMVTDVGGVNDESFNMLAWKGHNDAKDQLGFEVDYIESRQEADYMPNLETAFDNGAKLIWGIGFMMGDPVLESATKNPEAMYAIIDNSYDPANMPSNLIGVTFKEQEPSFLVGYIAGKMTKTNKIGFIGGMDNIVIRRFHSGFEAGVKYANPTAEFKAQYVDHFNDAAAGKAAAAKMYQDGIDIVFHAAGASGNGVIEAAKEQNQWVIGVDTDQNYLAPDNVITSSCKGVDQAILAVAKQLQEGTLQGGQNIEFGLKEEGVGIAPTSSKHVPAEILAEVDALIEKIKAGELVIPGTEAEVQPFVDALPAER